MSDRIHSGPWLPWLLCLLVLGCIEDPSTDDELPHARETGYLRCVAQTAECAPQLRCLEPEGGWSCVDSPPCETLTCDCAGPAICGDRACRVSANGTELVCGDEPDSGAPLACEDRPVETCTGDDVGCWPLGGEPLRALPGGMSCPDPERPSTLGCTPGPCGGAITYAAPEAAPEDCHRFPSTCVPDGWVECDPGEVLDACPGETDAALPPDAGPADTAPPDMGPPPDAAVAGDLGPLPDAGADACRVTIWAGREVGEDGEFSCVIEPDQAFPCGQFARCVCAAAVPPEHVEACAHDILIPRGAITLADFCHDPDNTIATLVDDSSWHGGDWDVEGTPACADIPVTNRPVQAPDLWICSGDEPRDPVTVGEVRLEDDTLHVVASYSGGCADHRLGICWSASFVDAGDRLSAAGLVLFHQDNDDPCRGIEDQELTIDLRNLRDAWRFAHGGRQAGTVLLRWLFPEDAPEVRYDF